MNLKSLRKFNISFNPVISNTPLLYAIVLLSCLDIMYMFQANKFNALFVFFLSAMIMTYFSKNMMVILFFALVITHIFRFGSNVSEGMESKNKEKTGEEEEASEDKPKKKADIDEVVDDMINNMTEDEKTEIIENKDEITKDFDEVSKLQETMINNVKALEPILNKAEKFMNKYGKYAKISEKYL